MNWLRSLLHSLTGAAGGGRTSGRPPQVVRRADAPPLPTRQSEEKPTDEPTGEPADQREDDEAQASAQLPAQPDAQEEAPSEDAAPASPAQPVLKQVNFQRRLRMEAAQLRQDPSHHVYTPTGALSYGIATDVGKMRENNEDACFGMQWHAKTVENRPDYGFFVIADGMGGHLDGEKAASIAAQTIAVEMLQNVYMPLLRNFKAAEKTMILEALVAAAEKANLAVIEGVPGGGTTLTAVAIVGSLAYLAHVGDSRAYLLQHDAIEQLTTDHTLVQRLIEMKELSPEEAEYYPQKNVLYRAIGQHESLKVERLIRNLPAAARLIICSDGLWDQVDDDTLKRVTLESDSPQAACDRLVSLANERGGNDNISVIIVSVPGNEG